MAAQEILLSGISYRYALTGSQGRNSVSGIGAFAKRRRPTLPEMPGAMRYRDAL
jgi:hypothetical protein